MSARVGVSISCPHRDGVGHSTFHDSYFGTVGKAPKRSKCSYCGGRLTRTPTVWGLVDWRADGRYERPDLTFPSPAQAGALRLGEQVVRPFRVDLENAHASEGAS